MTREKADIFLEAAMADDDYFEETVSSRIDRLVKFGLVALIALTAMAFGAVEYWSIALFGFAVVLLFLCWGVKGAFERRLRPVFPSVLLPLALAVGYGIFQTVATVDEQGRHWTLSMDPEATWLAVEIMAVLLLAGFLLANTFDRREHLIWLKNFLIFFGLAMAVFGLINHFTWNGKYYWIFEPSTTPSSPFGPFVNHNHFAGYIEMIAPIPVAMILTRAAKGELGMVYGFSAAIMSIAAIASLSRGGMISLLAGLMFVVVMGLRPSMMRLESIRSLRFPLFLSRILAAATIMATITVGVVWVGADAVIDRIDKIDLTNTGKSFSPNEETIYQSRGFIWEDTLGMIRANWLSGVGFGAYQTAYPIYSQRDRFHIVGQAHNDYLQALADGGIVAGAAVLLFLWFFFRAASRAMSHRDPIMASLALGCSAGVFAMLVHSLFDFNLQLISNGLLFLTLSIVVWRIGHAARKRRVSDAMLYGASGVRRDPGNPRAMEVWS